MGGNIWSGRVNLVEPVGRGKAGAVSTPGNVSRDCDHQVHSAARSMFVGVFTAWSAEERDKYVA